MAGSRVVPSEHLCPDGIGLEDDDAPAYQRKESTGAPSLATEWGRFGVRVNAVAPGVIQTTGLDHYPEPVKAMIHAAKSFNQTYRLGTAAEVSAAILFLLSPAAAFITGETLRVDGGSSIYSPFLPPQEHGKLPPFDDG